MSEVPPNDQNPNQSFKLSDESNTPHTIDQNPNQYLKSAEKPRDPYTIRVGDLIIFNQKENSENQRSLIVDVGKGTDFSVGHLEKTEVGKDMMSPLSFSTQGVNQEFEVREQWDRDKIKEVVGNYYEQELEKNQPNEADSPEDCEKKTKRSAMMEKMKARELARVDKWALNQTRAVTQEEIKEAIRKDMKLLKKSRSF